MTDATGVTHNVDIIIVIVLSFTSMTACGTARHSTNKTMSSGLNVAPLTATVVVDCISVVTRNVRFEPD